MDVRFDSTRGSRSDWVHERSGGLRYRLIALLSRSARTSVATLIRALDHVLPRTASAVAATALLGGAAAALAAGAREDLRRIGSLVPEQTVQNVKADVAAVAEAASTS